MESPPLYRAPPAPAPRPPLAASSEGHIGSINNDSDDIYEQLPSCDDSEDGGGSGEALVRPVPRPRTAPSKQQAPQQTTFMKQSESSVSDNFVRRDPEFDKFDNLWAGARRSNRDMTMMTGSMLPNSKNSVEQIQQQAYLANAFATGRRSHHHQQQHHHSSSRSVNNNGTSTQFRSAGHHHQQQLQDHHRNNVVPGRLNMAEYAAVTDALSRMRLPRTSPPYSNLPNDDYVSDTGHRNRTNRSRRLPGEIYYCAYYHEFPACRSHHSLVGMKAVSGF